MKITLGSALTGVIKLSFTAVASFMLLFLLMSCSPHSLTCWPTLSTARRTPVGDLWLGWRSSAGTDWQEPHTTTRLPYRYNTNTLLLWIGYVFNYICSSLFIFSQTVIHELFHALGFSKHLFHTWRHCSSTSPGFQTRFVSSFNPLSGITLLYV